MQRRAEGGTKVCTKCGKEKRFSSDMSRSDFYVHTRAPDGSIRLWQSWCKGCQRRYNRRRLGIKKTGKPYRARKKPRTREEVLEARRKQHAEKMKDPEYRERRREDMRMYATLRRRRRGIPERQFKEERVYDSKVTRVPAAPFAEWFLSLNGTRPTYSEMGDTLSNRVNRAVYGSEDSAPLEERTVRLDTVDEIAVMVGMPHIIHTLYPHIQ
jgi:hypothetical protein